AAPPGAVHLQRALGPDGVAALEDPVLPGQEPTEDLALERLGPAEPDRRLHAGERVGRVRRALLDRDADMLLPAAVVGRDRHEPGCARAKDDCNETSTRLNVRLR